MFPSSKLKEFIKYKRKSYNELVKIINIEFNNSPTTFEYISNLDCIKSNSNIHIINYPFNVGSTANQLNYAIKTINTLEICNKKMYFSIYNADSKPNENTFIELEKTIIANNFPEIIQQYSIFDLNFNKLSFIMKGFSLYQTSFEIRNGIINNVVSNKLYSPHVVTHGLTIRSDTLKSLHGFNTDFWCEDIYITGQIKNKNIPIIPLYVIERAETPEYLNIQIMQYAVWYKTAFQHQKILKSIKKSERVTIYGILWLLSELRASVSWILLPIFILYSLIYPLIFMMPTAFIVSSFIYLLFNYINYCLNIKIVKKIININFKENILMCFQTSLALLFTNLGPILSFIIKEKHKTAR